MGVANWQTRHLRAVWTLSIRLQYSMPHRRPTLTSIRSPAASRNWAPCIAAFFISIVVSILRLLDDCSAYAPARSWFVVMSITLFSLLSILRNSQVGRDYYWPLASSSLGVRLSLRIPQVASSNLDAGEICGHVSLVAAGGMFGKEIWVFTFHVNNP